MERAVPVAVRLATVEPAAQEAPPAMFKSPSPAVVLSRSILQAIALLQVFKHPPSPVREVTEQAQAWRVEDQVEQAVAPSTKKQASPFKMVPLSLSQTAQAAATLPPLACYLKTQVARQATEVAGPSAQVELEELEAFQASQPVAMPAPLACPTVAGRAAPASLFNLLVARVVSQEQGG
ncbi:hypothetical protein RS9916_38766 [Synechococcus sp. RS9916]|nr:hypothetical protein RS9916_38766 [Synechococcus sp. RS9916]